MNLRNVVLYSFGVLMSISSATAQINVLNAKTT